MIIKSVYVETSVWGMLVNEEPAVYHEATIEFFKVAPKYELFISPLVLSEISRANKTVRERIDNEMDKLTLELLEPESRVETLTDLYVERGIFTPKYRDDALHVAYASYNDMDFMVSFNFKHIVQELKRNLITAANLVMGYSTPRILWPGELVE